MGEIRDLLDAGAPVPTPFVDWAELVSDAADGAVNISRQVSAFKPLAQWRAETERAQAGGKSSILPILGDSFTEGYSASKRYLRWVSQLSRLVNGPRLVGVEYIPAACNAFSTTSSPASDWPGSQIPWVYTGAVTGSTSQGADLHAANIPTSGTISLTYVGSIITLVWTRTPGGPTAAAVTLDGVAQSAINMQGTLEGGHQTTIGNASTEEYGTHTLVVTATGAPMVIEGAMRHNGTQFQFGVPNGTAQVLGFGHTGFTSGQFVASTAWARSFAEISGNSALGTGASLVGIALGANDFGAAVSAATYRTNLVSIMSLIDSAIDTTGVTVNPGFLLIMWPSMPDSYVTAAWEAAAIVGLSRVTVLDLRAYLPGSGESAGWGIFDFGNGHPNDAGQAWIARTLAQFLLGVTPAILPEMRDGGWKIDAIDEPVFRSSWAASFGNAGTTGWRYDTCGAPDTTVRERRHRKQIDAGTYKIITRHEGQTTGATLEVLVDGVTAGTVGTTGTAGQVTTTELANTITVDHSGPHNVTVRKTSANGTLHFVSAEGRKTG